MNKSSQKKPMQLVINTQGPTRILKSPRILAGAGLQKTTGRQVLKSSRDEEE